MGSTLNFTLSGIDINNQYAKLVNMKMIKVDMSQYTAAQAYTIAAKLNTLALNAGACLPEYTLTVVDSSGDTGRGSYSSYSCVKFTTETWTEMHRWILASKQACQSSYMTAQELFDRCLKFTAHHPGSNYILTGEATHTHRLNCRYTQLSMQSWNFPAARALASQDFLNNHVLVCDSPASDLAINNGFLSSSRKEIYQTWPFHDYFPNRLACANASGTVVRLKEWQGDVRIGSLQLVAWCHDYGYADSPHLCWDKVYPPFFAATLALILALMGRSLLKSTLRTWPSRRARPSGLTSSELF